MVKFSAPSPAYLGPAAHTSSGNNKPHKRIVIHCTVSPCEKGGARNIAAYFKKQVAGGSAHYITDPGEVVQCVYDGVIAWHAPPNSYSIGVELCDPMPTRFGVEVSKGRWKDANHQAMLRRTADLVAQLCLAYNVPAVRLGIGDLRAGKRGITGHAQVAKAFHQSSHWDPGAGFPWKQFMDLVHKEIRERRHPEAERKAKPAKDYTKNLRIITANLWKDNPAPKEDAKLLGSGSAHIIGFNEAKNWLEILDAIPGYQLMKDGSGAMLQNPILVRDDIKVLDVEARKMCDPVNISPGRAATAVTYHWAGRDRVHIQTHSNSHIEQAGKPRNLPRVRANVEHMQNLAAWIKELQSMGLRVTVGGDFNWAFTPRPRAWNWTPRKVFNRAGLTVNWANETAPEGGSLGNRKIDYIAHHPADLTVMKQRLIKAHSDHVWPEVEYLTRA